MKNETPVPESAGQPQSLTDVLDQNEHVKILVDECAEELSSVNTALRQEGDTLTPLATIDSLLDKTDALEDKVQVAADKLEVVNKALEVEVDARLMLEEKLASVMHESAITRHAAFHDALTGLPNRALFDNRLEQGLAHAQRHGWTLAVIFIDLDNFKQVNDQHGHDVGDEVLKTIAERLKQNTREDDTVCRHGGDEFMFLLTGITNEDDVLQIAEKIALAVQAPCQLSIGEFVIRPSMGIALFRQDGSTAEELIKSADTAMYKAKREQVDFTFASQ